MTGFNKRQIPFEFGHKRDIGFDVFIAGPNFEALSQVKNLAVGYESKFIYLWGGAGSGKSHLLQAACHAAADHARRSVYIPMTEHRRFTPALLEGLEEFHLVCVDDIHQVAGDEDWERALMQLFNWLRENRHTMLISGNDKPDRLALTLADLKTRLSWDLAYYLKQLNDQDKIEALYRRADKRAFELSEEVANYILKRVSRDPRSLFHLLDRIDSASLSAKRKPTIPFVKSLLSDT